MTKAPPMESDQDAGLYFWRIGLEDGSEVRASNRAHPLLPLYCKTHDWWTDRACPADHSDRPPPKSRRSR